MRERVSSSPDLTLQGFEAGLSGSGPRPGPRPPQTQTSNPTNCIYYLLLYSPGRKLRVEPNQKCQDNTARPPCPLGEIPVRIPYCTRTVVVETAYSRSPLPPAWTTDIPNFEANEPILRNEIHFPFPRLLPARPSLRVKRKKATHGMCARGRCGNARVLEAKTTHTYDAWNAIILGPNGSAAREQVGSARLVTEAKSSDLPMLTTMMSW